MNKPLFYWTFIGQALLSFLLWENRTEGYTVLMKYNTVKQDEIHTDRQPHLDLLKALSIVCMILCHTVMRLAAHRPGYSTETGYLFGDAVLGCYVGVAHAFMLAMGIGFIFSKKTTPLYLLKRGISIYILGYLFNIFRFGVYALLDYAVKVDYSPDLFHAVFFQDIFQFAGLAMMLTALLMKLKFNEMGILIVGIVLSCIGSVVPDIQTGNAFWDIVIGNFVTSTNVPSHFTFLNWFIFVAVGMIFGKIIRQLKDEDLFYKRLLVGSCIIMTVFILTTAKYGMFFLNRLHRYYAVSILEAVGYLSIDFFLLSLFFFVTRRFETGRLGACITMSRNLTQMYLVHWCMLCFLEYIVCYLLKYILPYPVIYLTGICLIAGSYYISKGWKINI